MRFTFGNKHICTYCGEPADTIDHTIPYSIFHDEEISGHRKNFSVGFMTYCCRECNNLLGNRMFYTFQERCKYVNTRLRNKYKKFMGVVWDEEDLSQLSGNLREEIERSNRLNRRLRERVSWQDSKEFLSMLEKTMDEVYWSNEIPQEWKEFMIDTDYIPSDLK